MLNDPITKAKWVLETNGIIDVPAKYLQNLADANKIKVLKKDISQEPLLSGELVRKGPAFGIIINTCIPNVGRHNFTFAHELGHYFLGHPFQYSTNGVSGIKCNVDDLRAIGSNCEAGANRFAVELLMPESQFRIMMSGAPMDFSLIKNLANYYQVSKVAATYRLLDFTRDAYIVIFSNGLQIPSPPKASIAAKNVIGNLKMPMNKLEYQENFVECEPSKWFTKFRESMKLYECTHMSRNGNFATTILKIE